MRGNGIPHYISHIHVTLKSVLTESSAVALFSAIAHANIMMDQQLFRCISAHGHRQLAAGPDLRGALLAMAYLAQYPMTAALLRASQIGVSVMPLRRVRCPTLQHMQLPQQQGLDGHTVSRSRLLTSMDLLSLMFLNATAGGSLTPGA